MFRVQGVESVILSGLKIKEEVMNGNITIEPFNDALLNPNSYNYRLSDELLPVFPGAESGL